MIQKIVHIADIHIMNFMRINESKAAMERFLYDMAEVVHPDRILIVGDLLHSKNQPSPEATDLAGWFLEECAKIAKVILTIGNHDGLMENRDRMDSLTPIINRMKNPNISFYKDTGCYSDENVRWVVYSPLDKLIPKVETERVLIPKEEGGFQEFVREKSLKYYGLFHGIIQGSDTETGYVFGEGYQMKIFDNLDAVFCGDVHNRFVFRNNINAPVIMVGSFTQQHYRENLEQHGYCIFDVASGTYEFVNIEGKIKYMTFQVTDIKDIETGSEVLLNKA